MSDTHPLVHVEAAVLVAVGGFAGANARFAADQALGGPSATLAVNAVGSLLLGFVLYEETYVGAFSGPMRFVATTGFLSSFTTYSTFAVQTAGLAALSPLNVVANYGLALVGVAVGRHLALSLAGEEGA